MFLTYDRDKVGFCVSNADFSLFSLFPCFVMTRDIEGES